MAQLDRPHKLIRVLNYYLEQEKDISESLRQEVNLYKRLYQKECSIKANLRVIHKRQVNKLKQWMKKLEKS